MKKTAFLLPALLLFIAQPVLPSHFAGADLTYRCLGGNDYEISLTFYRDCSGIPEPNSVSVIFNCSQNASMNFSTTLQKIPNTGQEITQICPQVVTTCNGTSPHYGMREFVYRANVTLPSCNFWRMYYSLCCRNPSNTIANPTSQNGYIEAILNNSGGLCVNSPVFSNKPLNVICQGQTSCISYNAIPQLLTDSLSYEMIPPKTSGTGTVAYLAGYSHLQPLVSIPPLSLDPTTGLMCMTPVINMISPMAVLVKHWRIINGIPVVLGSVIRDMQINIISCNNTVPLLSGIDTTLTAGYQAANNLFNLEVCAGDPVNFNIWGFDADTFTSPPGNPAKFFMNWNNGIPMGSFSVTNNNSTSAYANFQWTPSGTHIRPTPWCFQVTIQDSACPYNATSSNTYCIKVNGLQTSLGNDTLLCQGESLKIYAPGHQTGYTYTWKINGVTQAYPPGTDSIQFNTSGISPGQYLIEVFVNDGTTLNCQGYDAKMIEVVYMPHPNLGNDTTLCGNSLVLDAGPGQLYAWSTGHYTQTITVLPPGGLFWVIVDGGNNTRCLWTDTIVVTIFFDPPPDIGGISGPIVAPPYSEVYYKTALPVTEPKTWAVSGGIMLNGNTADSVLVRWLPMNEGKVMVKAGVHAACQAHDTLMITIGYAGFSEQTKTALSIYPNPASTQLCIHNPDMDKFLIEIIDIHAKRMINTEVGFGDTHLDVRTLNTGLYFILIRDPNGKLVEKQKLGIIR